MPGDIAAARSCDLQRQCLDDVVMIAGGVGRQLLRLSRTVAAGCAYCDLQRAGFRGVECHAESAPGIGARCLAERRRPPRTPFVQRDLDSADTAAAVPGPASELRTLPALEALAADVAGDQRIDENFR